MGMFDTLRDAGRQAARAGADSLATSLRTGTSSPTRIGHDGPPIVDVDVPPEGSALVEQLALQPKPAAWFAVMTRADWGDTGPMMSMFEDT